MCTKTRFIGLFLICGTMLCSAADQFRSITELLNVSPRIYPYLVRPQEYPEYTMRPYKIPTWEDFGNRVQFVAGRNMPSSEDEMGDVPGRVYRPSISILSDSTLAKRIGFVQNNHLFIHNIGGYLPGSRLGYRRGEKLVDTSTSSLFLNSLGGRFTGFDIGEQDGRYNFTYHQIIEPYIPDKRRQYLFSQSYFEKIAADLGYYCSSLNVLWYWHYLIKEGYVAMAGAETQNKVTNGQVQYMFLRGAGKQYGVLWYGDISVFDAWGHKGYNPADHFKNEAEGGSLSLIKRSLYSQYMYNSAILSLESGWCEGRWAENKGKLTPLGRMQEDCAHFVEQWGNPGVMVTQIGLLNDYYSGWMPAEHIAGKFRTWNGIDWQKGDYLTDGVISMLYPEYEKCGFFKDETGAMCPTPYNENADCLLSDARIELLRQYPLIVAAGELFSDIEETGKRLDEYVLSGGTFAVTAENARRLYPQITIGITKHLFPEGTLVSLGSTEITEPNSFVLYDIKLPNNASVVASVNDIPTIVVIPKGRGKIVVFLSPFGINETPKMPLDSTGGGFEKNLERPYEMLEHVRMALDIMFGSLKIFSVNPSLGCIVNYMRKHVYRVAVYNNSLHTLPIRLSSSVGKIRHVKELSTGKTLSGENGYWPHGLVGDWSAQDSLCIGGGDIRLFDIEIENDQTAISNKIKHNKHYRKRYFICHSPMFLKETIRLDATFHDKYKGVIVYKEDIDELDSLSWEENAEWVKRQAIQLQIKKKGNTQTSRLEGVLFSHQAKEITAASDYKMLDLYTDDILKEAEKMLTHQKEDGLCIPAQYLANKSCFQLKKEFQILRQQNIPCVVNFIWDINHFPGYTLCKADPFNYEKSISYFKKVIDRMSEFGLRYALLTTHTEVEFGYSKSIVKKDIEETLRILSLYAAERNVRLLLTNTRHRLIGSVSEQQNLVRRISNVGLGNAINMNQLSDKELYDIEKMEDAKYDAVIMGAPASVHQSEYSPLTYDSPRANSPLLKNKNINIRIYCDFNNITND